MINHQPIFSIIVPLYNTEKYVIRCIKSILSQTIKNIEIIVVDDGSTDKSLEICQNLLLDNPKLVVLSKENAGQGQARNYGLKHAHGEFVAFVDSDDWIEPTLLEDAAQIMQDKEIDFLNFGLDFITPEGSLIKAFNNFSVDYCEGEEIFRKAMLDDMILSSPCNKIYRKDFLIKNNIFFPHVRHNEDIYFSRLIAFHANRAYFISRIYYHALIRPGSSTRKISSSNFIDTFNVLSLEKEFLKSQQVWHKYEKLHQAHAIKQLSYQLILASFRIESRKEYRNCAAITLKQLGRRKSLRLSVLSLLPLKNRLLFFMCLFPKALRFIAQLTNALKINFIY